MHIRMMFPESAAARGKNQVSVVSRPLVETHVFHKSSSCRIVSISLSPSKSFANFSVDIRLSDIEGKEPPTESALFDLFDGIGK